ncbi:NYN domain-containing protein [Methylobacterium sp. E-065]|uniref:NYN domain-containing protein n=1 Tax=Methylobacterium sp. E-065 TaxID=2836583 RepID=UPI001FB9FBEC|nr:NYN domain-containing protein [Methylobacterium sp. E-065]MCJ2016887.1 NYN domain-containing protein [Methylobacterium sp. E-065]
MRRVIAYIDGFNLYHAIDDLKKPHLKWVDLRQLSSNICGSNETLTNVYFFTALPTWKVESIVRHQEFIKAQRHAGVECVIGHFKEKKQQCRACDARWVGHEEKETDVAIAVQITADAFLDRYDRALIISADSDLAPALRTVRQHFPLKALNVIAPPGRLGHARALKPMLEITPGRLAKCLMPETATEADGTVAFSRPSPYKPPA